VAERPKAWTVFTLSNTGIVIPIRGMDICVRLVVFCVCVVLCIGIGLATGWSSSKKSYRVEN
jgi:hypothetical protein